MENTTAAHKPGGASLLAIVAGTPRVMQQARVIVDDHREQARSYKGAAICQSVVIYRHL
jgi:hypothetical protein